jgi:hypothetical protein
MVRSCTADVGEGGGTDTHVRDWSCQSHALPLARDHDETEDEIQRGSLNFPAFKSFYAIFAENYFDNALTLFVWA